MRHMETPLIQVVEKTEELLPLLDSLRNIFATRVPAVNRALIRHLETIQREYMWDFVANHWGQFSDTSDHTSLAYLLARRLATSLSGSGIQQLAQELGDSTGTAVTEGQMHPMRYYVIPPVEPAPLAGDIYQGQVGEHNGHWMLLTPSCDLVIGREKAELVLLARCLPLTEQGNISNGKTVCQSHPEQATESYRIYCGTTDGTANPNDSSSCRAHSPCQTCW